MAIAINCAAPAKTIIDIKVISKVEKPAVLPKMPQVSPKGIIPADKGRQSFNTSFNISLLDSGNVSGKFLSINFSNSFDFFYNEQGHIFYLNLSCPVSEFQKRLP